jgi:hypothetical protein
MTKAQLAKARRFIAESYEKEGRRLVDLVIDYGPPKLDPAEHESILKIARGDADGIIILEYPIAGVPTPSGDILHAQLAGPFVVLTAAELADRGLIPGGSRYRKAEPGKAAGSAFSEHTARLLASAARRAAELRDQHLSLRKIAEVLELEGFRPRRGGKWHVGTVAQLLKAHDVSSTVKAFPADHHA